jgi:hypothetical protein
VRVAEVDSNLGNDVKVCRDEFLQVSQLHDKHVSQLSSVLVGSLFIAVGSKQAESRENFIFSSECELMIAFLRLN